MTKKLAFISLIIVTIFSNCKKESNTATITTTTTTTGTTQTFLTNIKAITVGSSYSIVLKNDGTVWAFGSNSSGQLGNGSSDNSSVPLQIKSLTGIIAISGGSKHVIALKNDGTVWSWGDNKESQLGTGVFSDSSRTPVLVKSLSDIISISSGFTHSLVIKKMVPFGLGVVIQVVNWVMEVFLVVMFQLK